MFATYLTAGLCVWSIIVIFLLALVRNGADSRRSEQTRRIKRMEVTR